MPFALIFARRWTTLATAAAVAAGLCATSLLVLGAPAWEGFFAAAPFARSALENNLVGDEKMQSVFAAVRLLHGSLSLAWAAQLATMFTAVAALWLLQMRAFRTPAEPAAAVCAGLLATPFLLDYDLTLLALPLLWLLGEGLRDGFRPFEKAIMAFAFLLPLVSRTAAGALGLPLAPLTIACLFALVMRRGLKPAADRLECSGRDTRGAFRLSIVDER